jgi:SnoaL-like polyketide cyclase
VASRWTGCGTFPRPLALPTGQVEPNGRAVSFDEIRIDSFVGGRIVESWFIPDRFTLWEQMGVPRRLQGDADYPDVPSRVD